MAIKINEETGLFQIITKNTEYQMKADKYGVLKHLWYGEKIGTDMEYLLKYPDVGFSGNISEAENDRTYSLDTLPLEYSCEGGALPHTPPEAPPLDSAKGFISFGIPLFRHCRKIILPISL